MASIKFGGGITEMRGSIAGNVFSRNRYGAYVRARTVPVNPNTALQQAFKASLAFLADRWANTLTAAQRAAWNLYGSNVNMTNRLGETINLSGFNHYIRSNSLLAANSGTPIDAGPTVFELPEQDPTMTITASEATQNLSLSYDNALDWAVEANSVMWWFQGSPQNPQRNFFDGPWRRVGAIGGVDPGGPVTPDVVTANFAIAEGQRLWVYARIQRADGILSEIFRADTFCAA